jgi:hypothetical protein
VAPRGSAMRRARGGVPRLVASIALALLLSQPLGQALAVTKIEGEYQLMLDMRKSLFQRPYPWDFDSNRDDNFNYFQLRLFAQPREGVEAFSKYQSVMRGASAELFFQEAHVRFRRDLQGKGLDSYLFTGQDRFFVESYLIPMVRNDVLNRAGYSVPGVTNFGGSGVRLETWGGGFTGTAIATNVANGAYAARIKREFLGKDLRLGVTVTRKDFLTPHPVTSQIVPDLAQAFAIDSRYTWGGTDLSVEFAQSDSRFMPTVSDTTQIHRSITFFKRSTGIHLSPKSVVTAEIRSLRFGNGRMGFLNVAPLYWNRGAWWANQTGDDNNDEVGYRLNSWYLVPERSITLTSNYARYSKFAEERREETDFYNEAYIEFVNGFTGKTYLRQHDTRRFTPGAPLSIEEHDDWFNELQVESRLAWMRVQSKTKDVNHKPTRKQLVSLETRVNLNDRTKVYTRYAFGSDPSRLRKGIFAQLQYYPSNNVLMFLEYGPGWIGDSASPVDDGDLEGGGDQFDILKFIVKGNF